MWVNDDCDLSLFFNIVTCQYCRFWNTMMLIFFLLLTFVWLPYARTYVLSAAGGLVTSRISAHPSYVVEVSTSPRTYTFSFLTFIFSTSIFSTIRSNATVKLFLRASSFIWQFCVFFKFFCSSIFLFFIFFLIFRFLEWIQRLLSNKFKHF